MQIAGLTLMSSFVACTHRGASCRRKPQLLRPGYGPESSGSKDPRQNRPSVAGWWCPDGL